MERLKRVAREREEKLVKRANRDPSDLPNDGEEAGAAADEHADTWGFSWMPAIEEFVGQAAAAAEQRDQDDSEDSHGGDVGDYDYTDVEEPKVAASRVRATGGGGGGSSSSHNTMSAGELLPRSFGRSGRKRRRPQASSGTAVESASRGRRAPRPPSYNEILLADKSFHNPHASETMADAFGILRPASFVLDVRADNRPWGGAAEAATAAAKAKDGTVEGGNTSSASAGARASEGDKDRNNWFYDTVRDRQNRLWADARVRKGVELARKGQHQSAIDVYTQALGMCPDHDDGLVARGAAFATTGRLRQATQDLSRALSLNPDNDNASSYLKETRRRMERQETSESSPGVGTAASVAAKRPEQWTGPGVNGRFDLNGIPAAVGTAVPSSTMLPNGNSERDEASRAALGALLLDGAEGDALRKMRVLLEEDERKRKRGGDGGDGEDGVAIRKKKSRKKDKKSSSSKSKRRSSISRNRKKRDRRNGSAGSGGDELHYDSSSTSSTSSSGSSNSDENISSAGEADTRSSSSKKKAKAKAKTKAKKKKEHRKHKHKKRSSTRTKARPTMPSPSVLSAAATESSRNGGRRGGGRSSGGAVRASLAAVAGEDSGGDEEAHPILHRKKHSLWG